MPPAMHVTSADRNIGMEKYVTGGKGIGGTIRQKLEDFRVYEISSFEENPDGKYRIVEVTKENKDTHSMIREIARSMRVSKERFSYAGLKDKRAITRQKMSVYGLENIPEIRISGVKIEQIGRSNKPMTLGGLEGNHFNVVIRDVDAKDAINRLEMITHEIAALGGVANFFGSQRFGTRRPVTHLVGERIVKNDFEGAVMTYIAQVFENESETAKSARDFISKTGDFRKGLQRMPLFLEFERAMLDYLIKNPGDWIGSFSVLSKKFRMLFVHAYQAYIFNKIVSERLKRGMPINKAVVGDMVLFRNGKFQKATKGTLEDINKVIGAGRAWVTAPLVGYETVLADGKQGDIEQGALDDADITTKNFEVPIARDFSSKGTRRAILLPVEPKFETSSDELNYGKIKVMLDFDLTKGGYATVVLREYMKC